MKCAKCKVNSDEGATFLEGGIEYRFCKYCAIAVEKLHPGDIAYFMQPQKESRADRNIREARERRSRGELLWNS